MQIMHKFMDDFVGKIENLLEQQNYDEALGLLNEKVSKNPEQTNWLERGATFTIKWKSLVML